MSLAFLRLAYTMRELSRELDAGWDHKKLKRVLASGGVEPRKDGKVWICDIRDHMPQFFASWIELKHQRDLAKIRAEDQDHE